MEKGSPPGALAAAPAADMTPEDLFIVWQTGTIGTMIIIAGLPLVGEFSFRDHHCGPTGNALAFTILSFLWFVSVPAFALLGKWKFSRS